ncbi:DUF853 family protein [Candidatus Falkowbacteria bacterium]|nr:DUF853 family protein [Candidatus Falkowbacteria bacterium]
MDKKFIDFFRSSYAQLSGIPIGRPVYDGEVSEDYEVSIPIKSFTKHGLVAGSTGSGKSRAIQLIIEKLSESGVSVFLSDIKGDMSGFCVKGDSEKTKRRADSLNYPFAPKSYTANYWGNQEGLVSFRISLNDVDFVILAKLLKLNPTQESHLGLVYKYAKDQKIGIKNLKDLSDLVSYLIKYPEKSVGTSKSSLSVIYRNISNLEYGNLDEFFGAPSFDVGDFLTGAINVLWLQNYQKEKYNTGDLVSFFLYRLYSELPEIGDTEKPKLVVFIDEAHQIFDKANGNLIDLMVAILKQIRSKGVGIIFNTQNAEDIPEKILEQLGLKIQFSLRSFSQKELQEIKGTMSSFPVNGLYDLNEEIKSLESGTAFVSVLSEAGALLPPVKTMIYPPASLMDAPSFAQIKSASDQSLAAKYGEAEKSSSIELGSPLDNITVSRGGKWQMNTYMQRKEEQKVARIVRKKHRDIKKFMYLLISVLGIFALILFLLLIYKILGRLS